jgi:hypothetical protein
MSELITIAEVGVVMSRKPRDVEREANELGMTIRGNWRGEPAISDDDAKALVDGSAKATQEHERRWKEHVEADRRWQADRSMAGVQAAHKVNAAHRGPRDGALWSRANAAAIKAIKQYEKSTPRPRWPGLPAHKHAS